MAMVGGASLVLALALGVPELAAVGAGAAVVLLAGLLTSGSARLELQVDAGQLRVVEGDSVEITVHLRTHGRTSSVVVWVSPRRADGDRIPRVSPNGRVTEHDRGFTVELPPLDGSAKVDVEVRYQRWGIHHCPRSE